MSETAAILRYLDALSEMASLVPACARAQARMVQVIGVIDAYGYQPMVRDVFSHGYYRPRLGLEADRARVQTGLERSKAVLTLLDARACEGLVLDGRARSLADIHVSAMMDYFVSVAEAGRLLDIYPAISRWWASQKDADSLRATDPLAQP